MPLNPPQAYRKTAFTHRRGTRAAQPAAADVLIGTLYYVTDEITIERSTGSAWEQYSVKPTVNSIGTGLTSDGLILANNTASTGGATLQYSPNLNFKGTAWDTDDSVSRVVQRRIQMRTISGATQTGALYIGHDDGNGVFADQFVIGTVIVGDNPRFAIKDGNLLFRNSSRGISFTANPLTDASNASFIFSGDVSGGLNRLKFTAVPGYVFIEGNNASAVPGVTPSMDFRNFDGSTAIPIVGIRHRATKGGGPSAGFGTRQLYQIDSTTTADQNAGAFDIVWNDPTHASRSADFVISLVHNAAALAEKLRLNSSGNLNVASYSVGGTAGAAGGTFAPPASITVVNGIVTAIS